MKKNIALIVSILFSPFLVIAVFSAIVIYYHSSGWAQFALWCGGLVFFTISIPLVYIQYLVKKGKITDSHLGFREQRILPFVVALVGCGLLLVFYWLLDSPRELIAMAVSLTLNGAVFLAITKHWKISMHPSSFASSVMIISLLVNMQCFWLYLLLILIFWARLYRQKHNIWQLLVGAILSSIITATVIWLMNL